MSGLADDLVSVDAPARRRWLPGRRAVVLIVSAATTLGLLAVAWLLPVPFVKLAPGPTFNVIGEQDGRPVIEIEGTTTYPVTGILDMTTVLESGGPRGGLTFVEAIESWLDPSDAVLPREMLFPDDLSGEELRSRQAALFSTSGSFAVAAAMDFLGRPVTSTVVINAVYPDSPAEDVFRTQDQIISVDGVDVAEPNDVVDAVRSQPIGSALEITILREDDESGASEQTVTVTTADNPDNPGTPYLGIGVADLYAAEFPIEFTLEDVGGPSAGLMFALGIIDKLTPEDLTAADHIAGTGTITPDGKVGPIGGIRQKVAGAREAGANLFLMPVDHCEEIVGHVPDGLTVAAVSTLDEAVAALRAHAEGAPVAACPTATA